MQLYKYLSTLALLISVVSFSQENTNYDELYASNDTVKKRGGTLQEVSITTHHQKNPSIIRSGIKPMDLPQSFHYWKYGYRTTTIHKT